jgi:hypothetical protein
VTDRLSERRLAGAVVAGSIAVFLGLFAILPPAFETPDDAKYVGLGLNILAGHGLVTDFGVTFLSHPPLWPLTLAASKAWLGLDPLAVGHALEALFAAINIGLAAAIAWRVRPAAGAVTAAALLATPYLANLARTAGIDLPASAFALAFLLTSMRALDRNSIRLGLLAGVFFGLGFLIKETVIPFAPIPFLVALAGPRPASTVARVSAAGLLAATVVSGWWFVLYAALDGTVYRLGGPAWLLLPIAVVAGVAIVAGLLADRLSSIRPIAPELLTRSRISIASLRAILGWGGLTVWLLGQLFVYARAAKLGGASIIRISQLADDARVYLPQLGLVLGFGLAGTALAILLARRSEVVRELAVAAVAQVPLIVLVLAIGETPRHYIATICLVTALGAIGWVNAAKRIDTVRVRLMLALAGAVALLIAAPQALGSRPLIASLALAALIALVVVIAIRRAGWRAADDGPRIPFTGLRLGSLALCLVATLVVATGIATSTAVASARMTHSGTAEAEAIEKVGGWIQASLPPGATIMVGPALAYELALATHGQHTVVRVRPEVLVADAAAPLGIRLRPVGSRPVLDPLTLGAELRNVDEVDAYEGSVMAARIRAVRPAVWIEAVYLPSGQTTSPVLAAFDSATGMKRAAEWTFPYANRDLVVVAYAIEPDRFVIPTDKIYAEPAAVRSVARILGEMKGAAAAGQLLERIRVVPDGPDGEAALSELRAVAQGTATGG